MRSYFVTISTSKLDLILRYERMVTGKETTLLMHALCRVTPKTRLHMLVCIYLREVGRLY